MKPPKLLKSVDPSFSDCARELKVSGSTSIDMIVDEQVNFGHFVIRQPLGLGLDEQAIAALVRYRFAPATRDGVPVKVELTVESNFRIF
ncbi:energy transducer TonB [Granulicella paludicola]|uniref:energy transducer TonB n=1 Tax=Granulicella paludicola TaxID=474951 RepID=UPI0021DF5441|nr:energy transducer TonB [Granulicella paludicola]